MLRSFCLISAAAGLLFAADLNEDLLSAARSGDLAAVKALIEKGASIETKTSYGQTPLYLAAMQGRLDVVNFLLSKGANSEVRDTFYKAPLLGFVLQRKYNDVAKTLIAKGAGSPDDNLAAVSRAGNAELLRAVLEKAKPSQTALDQAYMEALDRKQTAVAELLKQAGAHEPAPAAQVDAIVLDSYAGVYKSDQMPMDLKLFVKEGKLYAQGTGQPELALKAKSSTVFEFAPARIGIEFDSPGNFTLKQGGKDYRFKKAVNP